MSGSLLTGPTRRGYNFAGFLTPDGAVIHYCTSSDHYRADAAVKEGDAVYFVPPTSANPLSVTPTAAATGLSRRFAGVALNAAAAGAMVGIVPVGGIAVVRVTSATTLGHALNTSATPGALTTVGAVTIAAGDTVALALTADVTIGAQRWVIARLIENY